jgi:RHS repeat-associated protein
VKLAASNSPIPGDTTHTTDKGDSYFDGIQFQKNAVDTSFNLINNSSFERGDASSSWPAYWQHSMGATDTWEGSSNSFSGAYAVSISNATAETGIASQNFIPYESTKDYTMTAFMKTVGSAAVGYIKIEEYDANKNLISVSPKSPNLSGNNDWKKMSVELPAGTAAVGTAYIRPVLMTGQAQGTVYFDDVRLQEGKVTTQYSYDTSHTWVQSKTDPLGNTTSYQYDAAGNVTQQTDPFGNITTTGYDSLDRVTSITPPGNNLKTSFGYDKDGNQTTITNTDVSGSTVYNQTKIDYNATGDVAALTDPLGHQIVNTYLPSGLLQDTTSGSGQKISYKYDNAGRVTDVYYNGTDSYQYSYDANNNVLTVKDLVQNRTWTGSYNELDLLKSWGDGTGSIAYALDASGNVTQKNLNLGTVTKNQTLTYNNINQPASLTDADGKTSKFLFNENGSLSNVQSGNGDTQTFLYDNANRITKVTNRTSSGAILSSYQYVDGIGNPGYNKNGQITAITDQSGQTLQFTYTANGQLLTETLPSGNTVTYSYDPLGNRTQRIEKKPDGTTVKTTTYGYDSTKSQLTQVDGTSLTYDVNGNLTANGTYLFVWDTQNRLTEIKNASDSSTVATYQYDAQNRRVQQTVNGVITNFLYDGKSNHVIAEYDGSGALTKYYTWSPQGQLLSITTGGSTYYTVRNAHGDIIQLTDASENVVATYTYDTWGNLISQTGAAASLNPYRYAGYRYDDTTGLYYLIARYYDPTVGRFISDDPSTTTTDYIYGANNPLSFVDQGGYWFLDVAFLVSDVIAFAQSPSLGAAAWVATDVISTAIPFGSVSAIAHSAQAIVKGAHAAVAARVIGKYDRIASKVMGNSVLKEASKASFKAADNVHSFKVSNKHLQSAGGNYRKFATDSVDEVNSTVKEGLQSPNAQFLPNNKPNSYKVITDLGRTIGTKGETKLQVIVGADGKIWTAYPIK